MSIDSDGNPLLDKEGLPRFSRIRPEHVLPALELAMDEGRRQVERLLGLNEAYTWDNLIQPLEESSQRLNRAWSPVSHLQGVADTPALREVYNAGLPRLSAYYTDLGQHEGLCRAYRALAEDRSFAALQPGQRKLIQDALREFHLSGVDLPEADKDRFKAVSQELSSLQSRYAQNLLDATQAWDLHVSDPSRLAGIPDSALEQARAKAGRKDLAGWVFTLDLPSYFPLMSYAADRDLRRSMYEAYVTRASDQGPHGGRWDNTPLMGGILALRHEQAGLLGFANYAEYSLARKMARSPREVLDFLGDLVARSRPVARQELEEVRAYARGEGETAELEAWDIPYWSERLRQHRYTFSQEDLRPYFPVPRVLRGLFEVARRLYGLRVEPRDGVDVWHPDVRYFDLRGADGEPRGGFYLDLYARQGKRGGAWMDEALVRMRHQGGIEHPVAHLVCNFTPPAGEAPSLLTHAEVTTLFHEFGHGLHHMLTRVDYPSVAGIHGVAWDAVELPSQLMENWCWQREALDLMSGHHLGGQALPTALYEKMRAARNFQSGMSMLRQLEFALFDFRLHLEYAPGERNLVGRVLDRVRQDVAVFQPPAWNRFANGFSHIFSGGYAAGYYSYKWAEVLSSDAFSKFEEHGIFARKTGVEFMRTVLEQGGSRDAMELFTEFRGREPNVDALLRHSGIAESTGAPGSGL